MVSSSNPSVPLTNPYAIFARARERLEAARYPSQLAYEVVVSVTKRGQTSVAHYHLYYDSTIGAVRVLGVSDEELAHPYTPHGINTTLSVFSTDPSKGVPLSAPQQTFDFLGVPILAPNYTFGIRHFTPAKLSYNDPALVQQIRREFHEPPKAVPIPAPSSGLRTIASVAAMDREYTMRLDGIDVVQGHDDYHLTLQPVREPERYRLRQLWINATTFALDRLVSRGNFVYGGATGVDWTTNYHDVGGVPYVDSETTSQPFTDFRRAYDTATVTFANIAPAKIPPYAWISSFDVNHDTGIPALVEPQP